MSKIFACWGAVAALWAAPASAAPVYLSCSIDSASGTPTKMDIQLNEPAGTVSYAFPNNGNSYTVRGIFAPAQVSFGSFVVDRSDLSIIRRNDDLLAWHLAPIDHGKCSMDTRSRAF